MKKYFCIVFALCCIICMNSCNEKKADEPEKQEGVKVSGTVNGHDYVDLGLSVMWATCNLGASTPEEIGNYYAWNETTPYNEWTWSNYNYSFNPCSPDNILSSRYDAVTKNWGENWRMPTLTEIQELIKPENCDWTWVDNVNGTGISGYNVTSKKNGNILFIPAGKYIPHEDYITPTKVQGLYWSSWAGPADLWKENITAMCHDFINGLVKEGSTNRGDGLTIRGVVGTPNNYIPDEKFEIDEEETKKQCISVSGSIGGHTYVDLGLPSRTMWATYNIGATNPSEYGSYFAWGETQEKELYNETTYKFFEKYAEKGKISWAQYTKYVISSDHGTPDYKLTLDPEDDAATQIWGNSWCIPSIEQTSELIQYCKWYEYTIEIGGKKIKGLRGDSRYNDNSIFLPNTWMEYSTWTNDHALAMYWVNHVFGDPDNKASDDYKAYIFLDHNEALELNTTGRIYGIAVRAVAK